jgi:tetratricopeptide (TPR) repeat protein
MGCVAEEKYLRAKAASTKMRAGFRWACFPLHQEGAMKRLLLGVAVFLGLAATASAQIGKSVSVAAGTPEDKALSEIYAAPDGPEKIALLDKFTADFGNGDLALLADQLYMQTYLAQKNYAKVVEYGEKALEVDPDNLETVVTMVHAADEQGDAPKMVELAEKAAAIIKRYQDSPPPEGVPPEEWSKTKAENVEKAQSNLDYIQRSAYNAAYKSADAAAKASLFERYAAAFPDSPYRLGALEQAALAYSQAQNTAKMTETANKILASDPNNVSMLLMLSDYWSNSGKELDKAAVYAQKVLDLLAQAKKPNDVTDDQWQQQVSLQKGTAYSSLGQVQVYKTRNAQAVDSFQKASPLLKSNTFLYARNLYRLGFTLAKMQKIVEARAALTEAVKLDSPFKALAQQTLDKIGGGVPPKTARKSS